MENCSLLSQIESVLQQNQSTLQHWFLLGRNPNWSNAVAACSIVYPNSYWVHDVSPTKNHMQLHFWFWFSNLTFHMGYRNTHKKRARMRMCATQSRAESWWLNTWVWGSPNLQLEWSFLSLQPKVVQGMKMEKLASGSQKAKAHGCTWVENAGLFG